jgi:ParB family chromosome partitioning protein
MQIIELNPADIAVSRSSIREDIGDVSGLAATIADQGLLQPLGVMARPEGGYELIYGHRRRSAALSLGLTQVPCLVYDNDDRQLIRQLTENLQRRDLNDLEQARAFDRLRQRFASEHPGADEGQLDDFVAQIVGLSPRSVRRYLGLLDLDEGIQAYLRSGQMTVTQAQHLRRINNDQTRTELARAAVDEGMSAAELSRLASYFAANPTHTLDSAINALQAAPTPVVPPPSMPVMPSSSDEYQPPSSYDMLPKRGAGDIEHDEETGYLRDDSVVASTKVRQSKIKSLDQMVDESDRLLRTYADGQLQRWIDHDENAPLKVSMVIVQLQRLVNALRDIAHAEQWPIELE